MNVQAFKEGDIVKVTDFDSLNYYLFNEVYTLPLRCRNRVYALVVRGIYTGSTGEVVASCKVYESLTNTRLDFKYFPSPKGSGTIVSVPIQWLRHATPGEVNDIEDHKAEMQNVEPDIPVWLQSAVDRMNNKQEDTQ